MGNWKDEIKKEKGENVRIDATTMYWSKYQDLLVEAMGRILEKHYSAPELELALIDMMNYIDRSRS
tara:strand:- start:684 stop:881 length:198 start_codon:yes stop_codon:yes gene_type:complete